MITLKAHAKINLTLEVLGWRKDDYHEIVSIIQTIDLHDMIDIQPASGVTLECELSELATPDNLVFRAARLLKERTGVDKGAKITLHKKIPVSAGLGGGSSDAAATLMGLNDMWGLSLSIEELSTIAVKLGSDVPFFLRGGTAMAHGHGECVRSLPPVDLEWLVILAPAIQLPKKTALLYEQLEPENFTQGYLTRKLEARIKGGGDVPPQLLFNVFDDVALQTIPDLPNYWKVFYSLGAREIHVAGTGPSLYAPVSSREQGTMIELMLRHRYGWQAHLVSVYQPVRNEKA